jgi:DNA-binding transcriptional regulator YiaG
MMKASCKKKTIENKAYRHCIESQLIEVMNAQLHDFQSLSATMATQRRQTKEIRSGKSMPKKEFRQYRES